jgi:hypothetical protein
LPHIWHIQNFIVNLDTMPLMRESHYFKLHCWHCVASATTSKDFDVTLMICLLRNLNLVPAPATGWDQLPPDSDTSLGANLTRIKVYRNKLSHPSKGRINDHSFKKIWSCLKTVCNSIYRCDVILVWYKLQLHRTMAV